MNSKQFETLFNHYKEIEDRVMLKKGMEYTQGDFESDRLANFKRIGKELENYGLVKDGMGIYVCWYVYFRKHIDSILCYIKKGKTFSDETIEGRIVDARNYLILLAAIFEEFNDRDK